MFILWIQHDSQHLTIVWTCRSDDISSNQTMVNIDADAVFVAVVVDPILLDPSHRASKSFWHKRFGFSSQPSGFRPALISLFSSRLFRCLGTGTRVASMIWPTRACRPRDRRYCPYSSKIASIRPAFLSLKVFFEVSPSQRIRLQTSAAQATLLQPQPHLQHLHPPSQMRSI